MRIAEKSAIHVLLYCVFTALFMNVELALGHTVQAWNLPVTYLLYILGLFIFYARRRTTIGRTPMLLAVILPVLFLCLACAAGRTFDTTWDGEDYQQSAVIALAKGWNPWHENQLPIDASSGTAYTLGYPKTTWLLQSGIYKVTGHIQTAASLSFVTAVVALVLVYAVLRKLRTPKTWSVAIASLAVVQIHCLQQTFTFMSDGYSYELSLVAIASFISFMRQKQKVFPVLGLMSSGLLMAGAKFSNLLFCGIIGLCVLIYVYKRKIYALPLFRWMLAGFIVAAAILLWVPYGTNMLRYNSSVYPQNHASERTKLRYDNVPKNLKDKDHATLLFYGVFGEAQPGWAGNANSTRNIARLKLPFTFHWYEVQPTGRVGNGGVLFGGLVLLAGLLYLLIVVRRPRLKTVHILSGATILAGLIICMALITPVPNMLRYTPLITLLPLIVLVLLVSIKGQRPMWAHVGAWLLTAGLAMNIALPIVAAVYTRHKAASAIQSQLTELRQQKITYHVNATHFYTNYLRLEDAHVPFVIDTHLSCPHPQALVYTYDTTMFCGERP